MQHDFIILDRSQSMYGMWEEALGSVNAYVKKLADDNVDTGVTLVVFDSNNPFEIIRDRITPKTWKPVTNADASPRGGTPLNDATARLVALANAGSPWGPYEKVAIIIMTDGEENASQEFGIRSGGTEKIKAMLDQCRAKGWQVVYLGANFDNQRQATSYGASFGSTIRSSVNNLTDSMTLMGSKRGFYGSGMAASMSYTAEEKTALASDAKVDIDELVKKSTETTGS